MIGTFETRKKTGVNYICPIGKNAGCNASSGHMKGKSVGYPSSEACKIDNYIYCY